MQRGRVGDAFVLPLAGPGLERVEPGFPAGGLDQELGDVGLAGEPLHRPQVQAECAADPAEGVPGGEELVDGGVAFAGPGHQAPLAAAHITLPVRLSRRRGGFCPRRRRRGRHPAGVTARLGLFFEAAAVRHDRLLGVPGQVVPQVPPVSDLDRVRGAVPGALGVGPGPVPADHRGAGMGLQPGLDSGRFPVWQQVDRVSGAHVHQDGPVDVSLAQREITGPEHLRRRADPGFGEGGDQAQQRHRVHGDP